MLSDRLFFFVAALLIHGYCYGLLAQTQPTSDIILSLDGNGWSVTNGTMNQAIPASVPGNIYTDLMASNILDEPYYGWNPMSYQWVANSTWTYTRMFNVSSAVMNKRAIQLICEGIDTKADIYLNNVLLFTNDNMFQRNWINVKSFVKLGSNTIRFEFASKVKWALAEASSCDVATDLECPYHCPGSQQHGFCDVNFIRTEPCSFSWDWGPAFSPIGIWKRIYLQAYDNAVIRDFLVYAKPSNSSLKGYRFPIGQTLSPNNAFMTHEMEEQFRAEMTDEELIEYTMKSKYNADIDYTVWDVTIVVYVDSGLTNVLLPGPNVTTTNKKYPFTAGLPSITGIINVTFSNGVSATMNVQVNNNMEQTFELKFGSMQNINPWFPNGFGAQALYDIFAHFVSTSGVQDTGSHRRFGFREIDVIQGPLPAGRSFFFVINGVTTPIHGSNWIPTDAFFSRSRVNRTSLQRFFVALGDSHQNMIRNWGGGIYQHEDTYDLADEYGILIWEDFMWACSQYWVHDTYLQSSAKEVVDQVRRIQAHPSIGIWAGNNENSGYCNNNPTAYRDLYWKTILDNVAILDPTRPRVSSSPSNGNETEAEPCTKGNQAFFGDLHSYKYSIDCWDVTQYARSRFMSEFGLQSWPSFPTMSRYIPETEYDFMSDMMVNRNHHPNGQTQILSLIQMHYNLPSNNSNSAAKKYEYTLYLTQAYQAYCYKVEVEFFRSLRDRCTTTESGCMMGQMYWQTNDIWPGASWASIDYLGRYKMAQYYSQEFYRKLLVTGYYNKTGSTYDFWGINDEIENDACSLGCDLQFFSYSYMNGALASWHSSAQLNTESATQVYSVSSADLLTLSKCSAMSDCILRWELIDNDNGRDRVVSENWMFLSSPKTSNAKDPNLQISDIAKLSQRNTEKQLQFQITFSADFVGVFVWFETATDGYFDRNGLFVDAGFHSVVFNARVNTTTVAELQKSLYVFSLFEAGGFANSP